MAASNILKDIENKYDVKRLKTISGIKVWPLVRQFLVFQEIKKTLGYDNRLRTRNKRQLLKNFYRGFNNIFRLKKFDYLFFNNTDKRVLHANKYFDIYFDAWADKLGQDKSLFVEWAIHKHLSKQKTYSKNVISDLPFKAIVALVKLFTKIRLEDRELLNEIIKEHQISNLINEELKNKLAEFKVFDLLFKITKPKAIFVLSSFSKISIVAAAKKRGVKVFEAQHGYIGDHHTFYTANIKFPEYYPDYLISFGTYEKIQSNPRLIFNSNQIIPIGSFQLELIKNKPIPDNLLNFKEKYDLVFCITLQAIKEDIILDWVFNNARDNKNWLFVIRTKDRDIDYSKYTSENNIKELKEYSIYEILKVADYNVTIYSTTAIEGIFLGAPPIFFNINNLSRQHFNIDKLNAFVIEDANEKLTKKELTKESCFEKSFFIDNYFENVNKTILTKYMTKNELNP